jgi:REP element-mobilizing transposase RayT
MSDESFPKRRSIRLKGYDYSQGGAYFVTICAAHRLCLFGGVVDAEMQLNTAGDLVAQEWLRSAELRPGVILDAFVVMPNHLHGVIVIDGPPALAAAGEGRAGPNVLPSIINGFKAATTRRIRELRRDPKLTVWQRNYYERIVRSERSLDRIREYIAGNPTNWAQDRENPNVVRRPKER